MATSRIPFYDVRDWWLSDARFAQLVDPDGTGTNFFPSSEDPQSEVPYVRYSVRDYQIRNQPFRRRQDVVAVIYTQRVADNNEAIDIIREMSQEDDSAFELNRWLKSQGRGNEFDFKFVRFIVAGDIYPFEEIGGAIARPVTVHIEYVRK